MKGMFDHEVFPLKVFVNPVVTVTNKKAATLREGCLSVKGMC